MAEITMPKLSDTMTEGTLVAWKKKAGDKVSSGDVIAEVETDKATMEMESFEDGVLAEIFIQEGQKVAVGEKIARVQGKGDSVAPAATSDAKPSGNSKPAEAPIAQAGKSVAPATASGAQALESAGVENVTPAKPGERVKASPLARKVAATQNVDLGTLAGTGPGGRIIQRDVLSAASAAPAGANATGATPPVGKVQAAASGLSAPAPRPDTPQKETRTPLSGMRKTIADRLLQSKTTIPHFYLHVEIDAAPLTKLRAEINAAGEQDGIKVSVNDIMLRAAAKALTLVSKVNASFAGDAIVYFSSVNLAVAVAVDEGLITPVIQDAGSKSLFEISLAVKDLAARARSKKLKPEEYQGGTFTVSNLGSYGIDRFDAIINPPQAAILSVGGIVKKPVVDQAGEIVAGQRIDLGLSCDHRVVDGAIGAQYLAALRRLLEAPLLLLM